MMIAEAPTCWAASAFFSNEQLPRDTNRAKPSAPFAVVTSTLVNEQSNHSVHLRNQACWASRLSRLFWDQPRAYFHHHPSGEIPLVHSHLGGLLV